MSQHPTLILIRGLPGSGKSYLAESLAKSLPAKDLVVLDPDATDYESQEYKDHVKAQTEEGVDPALHAYRFLRAQAYKGIASNKIVIWNQPFTNLEIFQKMVGRLQTHADEYHVKLPMLVVEVEIDNQTAKQRISARKQQGGHGPSDATFDRFISDYKTFEGLDFNVVRVNGSDPTATSVSAIMKSLEPLLA